MEAALALPIFATLLVVLLALGWSEVVSARASVAVQHAAWHQARLAQPPSSEPLRESLGARSVRLSSQTRGGWSLGFLDGLVPAVGDCETTLEVTFDSPFPRLLPSPTARRRLAVLQGFWVTDPDQEGLFGFLGGLGFGLPDTFVF